MLARVSDGIIAFDLNLNYTFVSSAAGLILGRNPDSLLGKNFYEVFPEAKGTKFANSYLQALESGKVITVNDYFEPWNRWFSNKIFPSETGITVLFYETTGDVEATSSLQDSEKHLKKILDNLPVGVAVNAVFPKVEFVYMNKLFTEYYCTTREELKSPDAFWDAVYEDPEFREEIKQKVLDGISSGDPERMRWHEVPITRGGEVVKYITANGIPLPDSNMLVSCVMDETARVKNYHALRNIEERNRTRLEELVEERSAQLIAANKELEAFSYSVSHDLRAPLRAITGFTQILSEEYSLKLGEEGGRICSVITNNALKMSQLIDDLLHFSRVARKDLSLSRIDMTGMVKSIFHEVTSPEQRERIVFMDDSLHECHGDPNMMRQVWTNLISNAVKFTSISERPVISIWSDKEDSEYRYFIKDNGVGFDMRYKEKLFGVFQRLHGVNEFEGTGVGLALVQRIIHKHGGTVDAESDPGKGTTFFFTVPEHITEKNMMGEKWKTI
ncbi:MAG: hypothetical protein AMXMBFR49_05580 [Chlorobiota bacterium]